MTEHAKEPWRSTESRIYANEWFISTTEHGWLMSIRHNGEAMPEKQRENVRRICAAINACAGIETEVLEQHALGVIAAGHSQQLHEVTMQRDELLAALKLVTDELEQLHNYYYRDCEGRNCPAGKYIELARSVMAMVGAENAEHVDQCAECKAISPTTAAMCRQCERDTPAFTDLVNRMVSGGARDAKHSRCEKQCQEAITCPAGKCALNDAATNDRYPIPDFLRKHRD